MFNFISSCIFLAISIFACILALVGHLVRFHGTRDEVNTCSFTFLAPQEYHPVFWSNSILNFGQTFVYLIDSFCSSAGVFFPGHSSHSFRVIHLT
jgi:hypothetical protein